MRSSAFGHHIAPVVGVLVATLATVWVVQNEGSDPDGSAPLGTSSESILVAGHNDKNLDLFEVYPNGDLKPLTSYPGPDYSPSWSPDRSQIAFVSDRDDPGNPDVYVLDTSSSGVSRVTTSKAIDGGPVWMPDGDSITFWRSYDDGSTEAFEADLGSAELQQVPGTLSGDANFSWSPSGDRFALIRNENGRVFIAVIDAEAGEVIYAIDGDMVRSPVFSPSGEFLAYGERSGLLVVSAESGEEEYRIGVPSGNGLSNVSSVTWLNDSTLAVQATYVDADEPATVRSLYAVNLETGAVSPLQDISGLDAVPGIS